MDSAQIVNDIRNAKTPSFGEVVHEVLEAVSGSTNDFGSESEIDVFSAAGEIPDHLYEKLKDIV